MSRLITFTSILLLTGAALASARSSADDDLLNEGARLYQEQQFEAALDIYREALSTDATSGPLLYNVGNAYFRTGQIGEAIRYYEKAARKIPDHPKVQHNLHIARQNIDQPIPSIPPPFWQRWWHQLVRLLGARGLFLVGLGAYIPAVGLIGYRIWRGHRLSRLWKLTTVFLLTVSAAGIGSGLFASWQKSTHERAVVISPEAVLYGDPAANSTVTRSIPEGTVVYVNEELPEWQHIRLPNGAAGWVEATRLGDI